MAVLSANVQQKTVILCMNLSGKEWPQVQVMVVQVHVSYLSLIALLTKYLLLIPIYCIYRAVYLYTIFIESESIADNSIVLFSLILV